MSGHNNAAPPLPTPPPQPNWRASNDEFVPTPSSSPLLRAANEATVGWLRRRRKPPTRFAGGLAGIIDVDAWEYRRRWMKRHFWDYFWNDAA